MSWKKFVCSIVRSLIKDASVSYFPIQWVKTSWPHLCFQWRRSQKILHCSFPYLFNKSSSVKSAVKWTTLKGIVTNLVFQGKEDDVALSFSDNCFAKPGSLSRVRSTGNYSEQTCMCFEQLLLINGAHNWRDSCKQETSLV